MKKIYTIGHSNYKIEYFLSLLKENKIEAVVDVRSTPFSRFSPQYNKEPIHSYLNRNGIHYIYMGDLLGAKYRDKSLLFSNGKVNFQKVQETKKFKRGVKRLQKGIDKGFNISLMCSEKEAFNCHRFALISKVLSEDGIHIEHIYPDKILTQKDLEDMLLKKYSKKLPDNNLFDSKIDLKLKLEMAYRFRNLDIAYSALE